MAEQGIDIETLTRLLNRPALVGPEHIVLLQSYMELYPAFTPLYYLMARAKYVAGLPDAEEALAHAAARGSSMVLHRMIYYPESFEEREDDVLSEEAGLPDDEIKAEDLPVDMVEGMAGAGVSDVAVEALTEGAALPDDEIKAEDLPADMVEGVAGAGVSDVAVEALTKGAALPDDEIKAEDLPADMVEGVAGAGVIGAAEERSVSGVAGDDSEDDENIAVANIGEGNWGAGQESISVAESTGSNVATDSEETRVVFGEAGAIDSQEDIAKVGEEVTAGLQKDIAAAGSTGSNVATDPEETTVVFGEAGAIDSEEDIAKAGEEVTAGMQEDVAAAEITGSNVAMDPGETTVVFGEAGTIDSQEDIAKAGEEVTAGLQKDVAAAEDSATLTEGAALPEDKMKPGHLPADMLDGGEGANEGGEMLKAVAAPENEMPATYLVPREQDGGVTRYDDETMPHTFLWWLNQTRRAYENYRPYIDPLPKKVKPDAGTGLQQQYLENIFSTQTPFEAEAYLEEPVERKGHEDAIIERFIKEDPQITAQHFDKIDNENKARRSAEDNYDVVSETLAKIYIEQMLYQKAIDTYQKLSFKYPSKSSYFAELIASIEKKIN